MIYERFNGEFGGKYLHAFNYFRIINKKIIIVGYSCELNIERTFCVFFFVHGDGLKTFRLHDTVNSLPFPVKFYLVIQHGLEMSYSRREVNYVVGLSIA